VGSPPATGLLVDVLGFLTGTVLYGMLLVMVWRERLRDGAPLFSMRGRLTLLTGVFGLVWNLGALFSFGTRVVTPGAAHPIVEALAFAALGFLPAAVVHAIAGGQTTLGRTAARVAIGAAYLLSTTAAILHGLAAFDDAPVPSRAALWLLTGGFSALAIWLFAVTRREPAARRGIWFAALAIFAVSALHFRSHAGNEAWWVELAGHHASLPLALAILHQDYRFALADLFLEKAIALLLLMGVSLALLPAVVAPLLRWYDAGGVHDARAVALIVAAWMATAMLFPWLERLSHAIVDRVVLKRPDYAALLLAFGDEVEACETEGAVVSAVAGALERALGVSAPAVVDDPWPGGDPRLVVATPAMASGTTLARLRTVDAPHRAVALGPLPAGRRLLSDDLRLVESLSRTAARQIDAIRVARERLARTAREQRIERLAAEAELRALRARLHPHFLFNALTTIGYLIQAAPDRALDTLLRLTSVLRGVLRRTTAEFSTLGDEMRFIASYLEIERARFEERLDVTLDVDPAAQSLACPTLLLQPLVENAVQHGLAPRASPGRVTVEARINGDALVVRVADTGVGFDPARAARPDSVGLSSVAQRLQAHYGDQATLTIESAPGAGTAVTITMPARSAGREGAETRRRAG
jgi:two-component system LytT family sensor kinase